MSKAAEAKRIEEKRLLSRKRIFYAVLGIDFALIVLLAWALIELFL